MSRRLAVARVRVRGKCTRHTAPTRAPPLIPSQVKQKVNHITLDSCKKVALVFESCVAGVDVVNCTSCKVQAREARGRRMGARHPAGAPGSD